MKLIKTNSFHFGTWKEALDELAELVEDYYAVNTGVEKLFGISEGLELYVCVTYGIELVAAIYKNGRLISDELVFGQQAADPLLEGIQWLHNAAFWKGEEPAIEDWLFVLAQCSRENNVPVLERVSRARAALGAAGL